MKRIILPLLCVLVISSCMKYEDGPCISFRSKDERLQGLWKLTFFTVNGIDSLQYYNQYYSNECTFNFLKPEDQQSLVQFGITWGDTSSFYYGVFGYTESISEVLTITSMYETSSNNIYPLAFLLHSKVGGGALEWPISRLKYNEVWFDIFVDNKEYELHLDNIKKY